MDSNTDDTMELDSMAHYHSMATRPQSSPLVRARVPATSTAQTGAPASHNNESAAESSTNDDAECRQRLLSYIMDAKRIFHCAEWRTWRDFASPLHQDDAHAVAARNQFVDEILPTIYDYIKTDELMRKLVKVLDWHPNFTRTARGYMLKPHEQRVAHMRQPIAKQDYRLLEPGKVDQMMSVPVDERRNSLGPHASDAHVHTLVQPSNCPLPNFGKSFEFSPLTGALVSACLSKDFELAGCTVLEPDEMKRRLREAKKNFEDKAVLPENVRDAKKLQDKLKGLMELKQAMLNLTTRSVNETRDKATK